MLKIKGYRRHRGRYVPPSRSRTFWRRFRKTTLGLLVLVLLLVIAGLIYAWYTAQRNPVASTSSTTIRQPNAIKKPTIPSPKAVIGVATQYISTPIAPGEEATMSIHTNGDATCKIFVHYANNVISKDPVLSTQTADDFGLASWNWIIPKSTPLGKGLVEVRCNNQTNWAHVLQDLVIATN